MAKFSKADGVVFARNKLERDLSWPRFLTCISESPNFLEFLAWSHPVTTDDFFADQDGIKVLHGRTALGRVTLDDFDHARLESIGETCSDRGQ